MPFRVFDGHCDTLLALWEKDLPVGALARNRLHVDLERARALGGYAQIFAVFGLPEMAPGEDLFRLLLARLRAELEASAAAVRFCRSRAEAEAAMREGLAAAFLSVEGAELLGCAPDRLEEAWALGVRSLCLTWNRATVLSGTCAADPERGLSAQGRDYVRLADELGLLLDVSHLSDVGFWDLEKLIKGPFSATHSNSRAVFDHPRNITDDMFRAIRDHGGTVGLNLYAAFLCDGEARLETAVRHIEHFLDLGGEKTLALGGDLDGCEALPAELAGIQDLPKLYAALARRGYGAALLDDIFYGNLMRVMPA